MGAEMSRKKQLNLHKDQADWRGQALCPLNDMPFAFDERSVRTIDGFMCTLQLPSFDTRRIVTLMEDASTARRIVSRLVPKECVWWNDERYVVGSDKYEVLINRMLRARFRKDRRAIAALAASRGKKLVHKRPTPQSEVSLIPAKRYCAILTALRKELLETGEIARWAA